MASLSLPRVLQLKKNSLDAEREQFEKFQTLAIQKAINSIETPVKEKHVRSAIIGTFQEQSAVTYWMVAVRLPLQDNRIVAWKFCHVTHKLLREGHPACLDDSQRHIGMIENLGKLWVHLREGYGRLIHLYCGLLVCKLKFHSRNPRFPGNLQLTADELDNIAENDVNNYFQLCVELFDYMDDILNLQAAVFESLGNARANSMTASGQCRLAALIPCAQDSSQIYDCNVRLLFRLHASLPPDTLQGHRERFRQQFKKLSSFYKHASSLQYYRNLLTLPVLPSNPPNFLLQSDFGTYVTPVVSIPEPPPDEIDSVGSLIDTSDTTSQISHSELAEISEPRTTPSPQPDPIVERDRLIDHLQNELKRMRSEVSQLVQERNTMLGSMREHCTRLESQLQVTKTELEGERQKAEMFAIEAPGMKQKLVETEDKAKVIDEKFQKLKGAYTQLREEHINLIRQKAEVDKAASSLRAAAAQHESAKMMLQQQLNDRVKDVELLQQSASSSEEIDAYKSEIANLRTELENARQKEVELENLRAAMETLEIEHKTATTEQQERVISVANELKDVTENLERVQKEKAEKEMELNRTKEELVQMTHKSGEEFKRVVEEKEAAVREIADLKQQYLLEKETNHNEFENVRMDYQGQLQNQCLEIRSFQQKIDELLQGKNKAENDIVKLEKEIDELKNKLEEELNDKLEIQNALIVKDIDISNLEDILKEMEFHKNDVLNELDNKKQEMIDLETKLMNNIKEQEAEIDNLQKMLTEKADLSETQNIHQEDLLNKISELETSVVSKDKVIEDIRTELNDISVSVENERKEFEIYREKSKMDVILLEEKLQHITNSKDELIESLKEIIAEKDKQVISLNVEVNKLSTEVSNLTEELKETSAELEIGTSELLNLKQEHENVLANNDDNLTLKNVELRNLNTEVNRLISEKLAIESEKDLKINELITEKQELNNIIEELKETIATMNVSISTIEKEKNENETKSITELQNFKQEMSQVMEDKNEELKNVKDENISFRQLLYAKGDTIQALINERDSLKNELTELEKIKIKEKEDMELLMSEKENENQITNARLEHTETERLNAECELQDLLQHNTVLEADVASLRAQLQDAQMEIKRQYSRLVTCAGETALKLTDEALESFEQASVRDTNRLAAELAAQAFDDLAKKTEISGNEESVAKTAIFAAHNTSRLSAYIMDICNVSTDMEASDKLSAECRSMLSATKLCLSSLAEGRLENKAWEVARGKVKSATEGAVAADKEPVARSVDDELASMDSAIEQAASQIEQMLAASRAADSGVKLEVNEKILDACTTLMGAVKVLVQDARRLQNELGDPKARQRMYRRNPQWSEGLISAAKAVVFAAKLLVSSADEAVRGAARVEGVAAAAHEVAGSTAQLVAASRARAPPAAPALARLTAASRHVAAAAGAVLAAARHAADLTRDTEALDTSALTLTATRRLEMESKVRSLELETALEAERARLAELRKRHYHLAQMEENGGITNGKE